MHELFIAMCSYLDVVEMLANLLYVASTVNQLIIKKRYWIDEFVELVIDVALLPSCGENVVKTSMQCLDLLRKVSMLIPPKVNFCSSGISKLALLWNRSVRV